MQLADITRYDLDPTVIDCVTPMPYGHLVYYTDHQLVVEHLLNVIQQLEMKVPNESN